MPCRLLTTIIHKSKGELMCVKCLELCPYSSEIIELRHKIGLHPQKQHRKDTNPDINELKLAYYNYSIISGFVHSKKYKEALDEIAMLNNFYFVRGMKAECLYWLGEYNEAIMIYSVLRKSGECNGMDLYARALVDIGSNDALERLSEDVSKALLY